MSNTLIKSASWTAAACSGTSMFGTPLYGASVAEATNPGARLRGLRGLTMCGTDLRIEQRIQDQGRSVFEHLLEGMTVQAPATAHVGVTVTGDVSGPYPWRQPV
ncbi:hypothetical protein [Actinomadura pelletieri]|uniref:hypothetical protein n=1 Tax=Actinomadura pelletieri TaxID=111805 RepID=UPI000EADCCD7|nr:hypothetical protein [Actinomadura pelletieri]